MVVGRPVGRIEAVTAGGPGFVAVGRGCVNTGADLPTCEGVVWTSTDGKAWQRTPAGDPTDTGAFFPTSGPEIGMFDVAAGGPGIVAIGYAARPDMAATIWFSSDNGASWERAKIGDVGSTRVNAIAWDGRQFVMVGEDRSQWDGTLEGMAKATARAAVWTSTDGYNFTRVPHSDGLRCRRVPGHDGGSVHRRDERTSSPARQDWSPWVPCAPRSRLAAGRWPGRRRTASPGNGRPRCRPPTTRR